MSFDLIAFPGSGGFPMQLIDPRAQFFCPVVHRLLHLSPRAGWVKFPVGERRLFLACLLRRHRHKPFITLGVKKLRFDAHLSDKEVEQCCSGNEAKDNSH
jgi:hypothetical protein